jgi:serine/threonine protein kinase
VPDLIGQSVKGYEIEKAIGSGTFATVYRAYQPVVEREVAIKVIHANHVNDPEFIRRFEVEAQVIARLEHPYIVPLYDYWRSPEGAYLVMRFFRGGSLRQVLSTGPLSLKKGVTYLQQIAAALAVAHRNGIVHQDIKPDNILLDENGNAYLSDFGIAKVSMEYAEATTRKTVYGSPAYMSPEAILAEPTTSGSDIYSLGIMLYELLTGSLPFDAESNA